MLAIVSAGIPGPLSATMISPSWVDTPISISGASPFSSAISSAFVGELFRDDERPIRDRMTGLCGQLSLAAELGQARGRERRPLQSGRRAAVIRCPRRASQLLRSPRWGIGQILNSSPHLGDERLRGISRKRPRIRAAFAEDAQLSAFDEHLRQKHCPFFEDAHLRCSFERLRQESQKHSIFSLFRAEDAHPPGAVGKRLGETSINAK
jgi:hypothetical protein